MKWKLKDPVAGDMIRVKVGTIYHVGIYVSDDEVIQFGLAPSQRLALKDSEIEVLASDIDQFLCGGFLEVAQFDWFESRKNRKPQQVVEYARSKIGTRGYNILYNNCEHFANECISGTHASAQADDVRAMFRSMPIVDVYFARVPQDGAVSEVHPPARSEEIQAVTNDQVKLEKYYVWKLLEYALDRSFGFRMKKLEFSLDENGRWNTPACDFSLSHCGDVVCVAVSRAKVGVDVEALSDRFQKLIPRMLNESEQKAYDALAQEEQLPYLAKTWTAKEAIFKTLDQKAFMPSEIQIDPAAVKSDLITLEGESFAYTVATQTPRIVRIFPNVKL